jgi:undecaprenyl diphosphate synthase
MLRLVRYLSDHPIQYVTLYAFSTENWGRPEEEVQGLFALLARFVDRYLAYMHGKDLRLVHVGRLEQVPERIQETIRRAVELTKDNTRMTLNFAFNYGGRAEIVDAVRRIVADGVRREDIDEGTVEKYLYTVGSPPVDLLIRTGGEARLSNFLIWQTAYSEYYLSDVLWPDFGKKDVEKALLWYSQRNRRFGAL